MTAYLIVGAGGHAKVVADILLSGGHQVAGFLDDQSDRWGTTWFGLPVLGGVDDWAEYKPEAMVLGIGDNDARRQIVQRLGQAAARLWQNAIHPRATLAGSVRLGHGLIVVAGAVVNPDVELGDHVIVNTGATIDHDCVVGAFAHVSPGVHLSGGVQVGEGAWLGVGSAVIPGRSIGAWSVVGAGAVVIRDIPANSVAVGVPARVIRRGERDKERADRRA